MTFKSLSTTPVTLEIRRSKAQWVSIVKKKSDSFGIAVAFVVTATFVAAATFATTATSVFSTTAT